MKRCDVIIVLGAAVRADGAASPLLRRRVARGIEAFKAGAAPMLLFTGGRSGGGPIEAEIMRELAVAAGIPADAILLERRAHTTFENAAYAAEMMKARGWSSALVVTNRLHLPRALLAFRAMGIAATGCAATPAQDARGLAALLVQVPHEALGLVWYAIRYLIRRLRA
jgi:uncharacterized SAM-binding protein YcdF (DUF218 family)